jgi:hypothetical protein
MVVYDYVIITTIIITLALCIMIILHAKKVEKKYFNNGLCIDCKTPFERLNEEGARLRSYYCPNCMSIITIFFRVDKNINVKQHPDYQEEIEEVKNEEIDSVANSL